MRCDFCGEENDDSAVVCRKCGQRLNNNFANYGGNNFNNFQSGNNYVNNENYFNSNNVAGSGGYQNGDNYAPNGNYSNNYQNNAQNNYPNNGNYMGNGVYQNSGNYQQNDSYQNGDNYQQNNGYQNGGNYQQNDGYQNGGNYQQSGGYQNGGNYTPNSDYSNNNYKSTPKKKEKKSHVGIIIAVVAVVIILVSGVVLVLNSAYFAERTSTGQLIPSDQIYTQKSFYDIYLECNCESPWASYGSDYLYIDTNPYDWDDDDSSHTGSLYLYTYYAGNAIQKINNLLGFPSYVFEDMKQTRAIDGRQTYRGNNYSASWTYHPDQGLQVRYTKN